MGAAGSTLSADDHVKVQLLSKQIASELAASGKTHDLTPEELEQRITTAIRGSLGNGALSPNLSHDVKAAVGLESNANPNVVLSHECRDTITQIHQHRALTFLVSVDGSEGAHMAFTVACGLRRGSDQIAVYHAYDSVKPPTSLASTFSPSSIRERYEIEALSKMRKGKMNIVMEDKEGKPAAGLLVAYLAKINKQHPHPQPLSSPRGGASTLPPLTHVDFVFAGSLGRKGTKQDSTGLGTTANSAINTLRTPVVIIKKPLAEPPLPPPSSGIGMIHNNHIGEVASRHFMVAVDGSDASHAGFLTTLLLMSPADRLTIIHVYNLHDAGVNAALPLSARAGDGNSSSPPSCARSHF